MKDDSKFHFLISNIINIYHILDILWYDSGKKPY